MMINFSKNIGVFVATAIVSTFSIQTVWAAGEGPGIVERWKIASEEYSFLNFDFDDVTFNEANNETVISGATFEVNFDLNSLANEFVPDAAIGFVITTGEMIYTNLRETSDRYFHDGVKIDKAAYSIDLSSMQEEADAQKMSYNNIVMGAQDWQKLPALEEDPLRPFSRFYPVLAAMVSANSDAIYIDNMSSEQQIDPRNKLSIAQGPIEYGPMNNGNIDYVKVDRTVGRIFSLGFEDGKKEETLGVFSMGPSEVVQYNLAELILAFDPNKSSDSSEYKVFYGDSSMKDFTLSADIGIDAEVKAMDMGEIWVRSPDKPILLELDKLYLASQKEGFAPDEKELIRLGMSFMGMFKIAGFDISGIKLDGDIDRESFRFSMDNFGLKDVSSDGLGYFGLKGIDFTSRSQNIEFKLGEFQIADIGFPSLDALMNVEEAQATQDINGIIAAFPKIGLVEISKLFVDANRQGKFNLDLMSFSTEDFIGRLPTSLAFIMENFSMPVKPMDREAREVFEKLGFDEIEISASEFMKWDDDTSEIIISSESEMKDAGALSFKGVIGGVPRSLFENPADAMGVIVSLTLNSAKLVFEDDSIVARGVGFAADETGKTKREMREQILQTLLSMVGMLGRDELEDQINKAAEAMLENGGTLTAEIQPKNPISFLQIAAGIGTNSPGVVVDLLKPSVDVD